MFQRKQFTFYESFYEAVRRLGKRDQRTVLMAITEYGLFGETSEELSNAAMATFVLVRPVLDSGRKKAEGGAKKRKDTGKIAEASGKAPPKEGELEKEVELEKEIEIEIEHEVEHECVKAERAFQEFCLSYPKKTALQEAREAWLRLNPDEALVKEILEGLALWKASDQWRESGGRYVPRAAKWLEERHWEFPPNPRGRELDEDEIAAIRRLMAD